MHRDYQQLSLEERDEITVMSWEGKSLRQIAQALGRAPKGGLPPLAEVPHRKGYCHFRVKIGGAPLKT